MSKNRSEREVVAHQIDSELGKLQRQAMNFSTTYGDNAFRNLALAIDQARKAAQGQMHKDDVIFKEVVDRMRLG